LTISPLTLYRSVSSASQSVDLTLTYARGNAGTASQYSFILSPTTVINLATTNANTSNYTYPFTSSIPQQITFLGTVSYIAGNVCLDSNSQPQLPSIPAGTIPSNSVSICTIFPWIYGSVSSTTTLATFIGTCVDACKQACCVLPSTPPLTVNFNAVNTNNRKSYLAIPQSLGSQNNQQIFNYYCQGTLNSDDIPGPLWTYSTIYPVNICGVNHTYSVYLFNYESLTSGPFTFCRCI
jgi:hypothetical protein